MSETPEDIVRELTEDLAGIEQAIKETPRDPNVKVALDITGAMILVGEVYCISEGDLQALNEMYDKVRADYDAMAAKASIPGCPWLDDPRYV